jgi:hypothetical protein
VPTPPVAKTHLHNAVGNGKAAIWSEAIIASEYRYKSLIQKGNIDPGLKLHDSSPPGETLSDCQLGPENEE